MLISLLLQRTLRSDSTGNRVHPPARWPWRSSRDVGCGWVRGLLGLLYQDSQPKPGRFAWVIVTV
jgi:hypothetical protein